MGIGNMQGAWVGINNTRERKAKKMGLKSSLSPFSRAKKELWASEWHSIFKDTDDARKQLTWRDRLGERHDIPYYNFYSSGEEVLGKMSYEATVGLQDFGLGLDSGNLLERLGWEDSDKTAGRNAWALQEKLKGRMLHTPVVLLGSTYGGWGFNHQYDIAPNPNYPNVRERMPSELANQESVIPLADLKSTPFFDKGTRDNDLFTDSPLPLNYIDAERKARLLAEFFPALTLPAGANPTGAFDLTYNNFNMQLKYQNGWPEERGNLKPWFHSDIRDIAYLYTYKLFDKFRELMEGGQQ